MIRIKDHKQGQLFDPWAFLSPKRRRMLNEDWPGLFREHLLQELPVAQMMPFFRRDFGRPCKELHTVLGVLLFQQSMDLTDAETIQQLAYNIQWHYALDLYEESDEAKTISAKTLWSMRQHMLAHNLDEALFECVTDKLAKVFKVSVSHQRLDSVHIRSNMRRLGRIGIFSRSIFKFLVNLKRQKRELFEAIERALIERYWGKKALAAFSLVKPSQAEKTLKLLSADLLELIEQFKGQPMVCAMHSYQLLRRVLADQCQVQTDEAGGCKVTVKKPAEVPSGSLQNPSDPDASYSGHKGQGYKVQLMESFQARAEDEKKEPVLNLITHVAVHKACEGDARALLPAIADTKVRGLGAEQLLADSAYGSDANCQLAAVAHVELVAPTAKGAGQEPLSGFSFDDRGLVTGCPAGHCPEQVFPQTRRSNFGAAFALQRCRQCALSAQCPVRPGKRNAYLRYSAKQLRLARRRALERTEAFIRRYRWRAGIEATISQYDRRTGVKHLRVRTLPAVRLCARLKAAGLNLLRAARFRRARGKARGAFGHPLEGIYTSFSLFKEHIRKVAADLESLILKRLLISDYYAAMAA